jgi:hypothetical protein
VTAGWSCSAGSGELADRRTWRPGDAELALLPYERPGADPDDPVSYEFLVLEP